jgi:hypothetical protein
MKSPSLLLTAMESVAINCTESVGQ